MEKEGGKKEGYYVYRISTAKEWEDLQKWGSTLGSDLDKSSAFIHLSDLHQVQVSTNIIIIRVLLFPIS